MCKLISILMACLYAILPFGICRPEPVENAYLLVFQEVITGQKKHGLEFVALNLGGAQLDDTTKLEKVIQTYCDELGITIVFLDYEGLREEGYLNEDGILQEGIFVFMDNDIRLTRRSFIARAGCFYGPTSGYTATYEVMRIHGKWEIVNTSNFIIS